MFRIPHVVIIAWPLTIQTVLSILAADTPFVLVARLSPSRPIGGLALYWLYSDRTVSVAESRALRRRCEAL